MAHQAPIRGLREPRLFSLICAKHQTTRARAEITLYHSLLYTGGYDSTQRGTGQAYTDL